MKHFLILFCTLSSALGDCWWTGCQLDSWGTVGCNQYGRTTQGTQPCPGGNEYNCCSQDGPTARPGTGSSTTSPSGSSTTSPSGGSMPTWTQFSNAVTSNGFPAPSQTQYSNFVQYAPSGQISTLQEAAMALAQFLHESGGLQDMREEACITTNTNCPNSYRSPGCDAPGQYYFGRGYIQLSWCQWNYRPASQALYGDDRLVQNPDMVAQDDTIAWATSFWYWSTNVHNANGVQQGQYGATTNAINGPIECSSPGNPSAANRFQLYGVVRQAFGLPGPGDPSGCA